ncbi:MAG: hypothetical protein QOD10_4595, partial [Mycobacterium sp.]|nr:hypothetical protein [Mycobacterium sp.]
MAIVAVPAARALVAELPDIGVGAGAPWAGIFAALVPNRRIQAASIIAERAQGVPHGIVLFCGVDLQ